MDANEPVLGDSTGQEVAERRFDEGRQRMAAGFGLGKEAVQFGGDDSVDEFLLCASGFVGVRGSGGSDPKHAPVMHPTQHAGR
jgi:hypothetical protein